MICADARWKPRSNPNFLIRHVQFQSLGFFTRIVINCWRLWWKTSMNKRFWQCQSVSAFRTRTDFNKSFFVCCFLFLFLCSHKANVSVLLWICWLTGFGSICCTHFCRHALFRLCRVWPFYLLSRSVCKISCRNRFDRAYQAENINSWRTAVVSDLPISRTEQPVLAGLRRRKNHLLSSFAPLLIFSSPHVSLWQAFRSSTHLKS